MSTFRFRPGLRLATHDGNYIIQEFISRDELSLVNTQTGEMVTRKMAILLSDLADGKLIVQSEPNKSKRSKEHFLSEVPEDHRKEAKRRFDYVIAVQSKNPLKRTLSTPT